MLPWQTDADLMHGLFIMETAPAGEGLPRAVEGDLRFMMVIRRIIFYLIVLSFTPLLPLIAHRGTDLPARAQDDSEESSRGEKPEKKAREGENPWEEQQVSWPRVAELPKEAQADMVMYSEDCYCIYNGSRYGFLSADGEEITPFLYDQAAPFSEGLACVSHHGKYGFIGRDGRTKIPFLYDQASSFSEGLAFFCLGEDYGFLDYEGNVVLRPECDSVSTFREGLAYFSIDGLYGYLDKNGKIVAEPIYEDAGQFQNGLAMVVQNGKYGLIGRDGGQVLAPEYDWIDVADGFIRVQKDGKMYCFDKESGRRLTEGWDDYNRGRNACGQPGRWVWSVGWGRKPAFAAGVQICRSHSRLRLGYCKKACFFWSD